MIGRLLMISGILDRFQLFLDIFWRKSMHQLDSLGSHYGIFLRRFRLAYMDLKVILQSCSGSWGKDGELLQTRRQELTTGTSKS
jgi:hypothetical protein